MSLEEERWISDRRNGTLDDPIDPSWEIPNCTCCSRLATVAIQPNGFYASGSLSLVAPYEEGTIYYCNDHSPRNKERSIL